MEPITKTKKLAEACERLAQHPFVTVDTEFLREIHLLPETVRRPDGDAPMKPCVVDALAAGIDLAPLFELMANEKVDEGLPRRAPGHRNLLARAAISSRRR